MAAKNKPGKGKGSGPKTPGEGITGSGNKVTYVRPTKMVRGKGVTGKGGKVTIVRPSTGKVTKSKKRLRSV